MDDILWTRLANFITSHVDIFNKAGKELKNESPAQPDGSRGQTHVSATPDKTHLSAAVATA
jgi:hypothetical protein